MVREVIDTGFSVTIQNLCKFIVSGCKMSDQFTHIYINIFELRKRKK